MLDKAIKRTVESPVFYINARKLLLTAPLTNVERAIFHLIDSFYSQHKRPPKASEVEMMIAALPKGEAKYLGDYRKQAESIFAPSTNGEVGDDFLLASLNEEVTKHNLKDGLFSLANNFDSLKSSNCAEQMRAILAGLDKGDLLSQSEELFVEEIHKQSNILIYQPSERISTGITALDLVTYGGIGRDEIVTVIAPSGRGKTVFLMNMAWAFVNQGYKVVYISLEMTLRDLARRAVRRILCKEKGYLREENLPSIVKYTEKFFALTEGKWKISKFPANAFSVEDLRDELTRLQYKGYVPDVIIVDHLDLLISKKKNFKYQGGGGFSYWRMLVDDLREVVLENSIPIITATQSTRASTKKVIVEEKDVGESYGKVQSSDIVLSLNQTPDELKRKRMRLAVLKNRDFYKGQMIEMCCNFDYMLMCDLQFAEKQGYLEDEQEEEQGESKDG